MYLADGVLSPQRTLPPALPPKSPRLVAVPQRRAISGPPSGGGSDQLQTKLRRLLNTDSKENVFFPDNQPGSPSIGCREEEIDNRNARVILNSLKFIGINTLV